jgi:hypothetical protein
LFLDSKGTGRNISSFLVCRRTSSSSSPRFELRFGRIEGVVEGRNEGDADVGDFEGRDEGEVEGFETEVRNETNFRMS